VRLVHQHKDVFGVDWQRAISSTARRRRGGCLVQVQWLRNLRGQCV